MTRFHIMTIFPDMVKNCLMESIIGRAVNSGAIALDVRNIRDYSADRHSKTDDYPYGGGAGMLMTPQPIYDCYRAVCEDINGGAPGFGECGTETSVTDGMLRPRTVYLSPKGKTFDQAMAKELAREDDIVFLCGHYEGVDERVLEKIVTDYVSIGDYVITGGELAAMVMTDAIARMVPGVLTNEESGSTESFEDSLLEYPQYTRPEVWEDMTVPPVLLSGDHARIDNWRHAKRMEITRELRPDLFDKAVACGAQWPKIKKQPVGSESFE